MSLCQNPVMATPFVADIQTWECGRNKEQWGDGPWVGEPDKAQWRDAYTGLTCLAVRNVHGSWCGYVGVPLGHPLHEVDWGDSRVRVVLAHGGLNYSDHCQEDPEMGPLEERVCHLPSPGAPDDLWWLGFDCGQHFDYVPQLVAEMKRFGEEFGHDGVIDLADSLFDPEKYRTLDYVQAMCAFIAWQLALMALTQPATSLV